MNIKLKYSLGDEVEDIITGFRGIITMIYLYLDDSERYLVQPKCDISFIFHESQSFPESRLKLITNKNTLKIC